MDVQGPPTDGWSPSNHPIAKFAMYIAPTQSFQVAFHSSVNGRPSIAMHLRKASHTKGGGQDRQKREFGGEDTMQ